MSFSSKLPKASRWERERASLLHSKFQSLELAIAIEGQTVSKGIKKLSKELKGHDIIVLNHKDEVIVQKPIKASEATLWKLRKKWVEGGRTLDALFHNYRGAGHHAPVPDTLSREIQRLASTDKGGRDKHGRGVDARVFLALEKTWKEGKYVTGLGTWQEFWLLNPQTKEIPLPKFAPEFPWCKKTVARHTGHQALKSMGNIGIKAAKKHLPYMSLDYSNLRRAEAFTLDDVQLDFYGINDFTGEVVPVTAYIMMEIGSRYVPAFVLRPGDYIAPKDVDDLIAKALGVTGIGVNYQTHIIFERGTIACSEACQRTLEGGSGDRIKVHRTGMTGGIRWVGSAADTAKGNSEGKAVIESFNRQLHYRLLHLPGQRGNNWMNSPANLGAEKRSEINGGFDKKRATKENDKRRKSPSKLSLVEMSEVISRFKHQAQQAGVETPGIKIPLGTISEITIELQKVITDHNNDPGHNYQGHHKKTQVEVAPGMWVDV